MNKGNDLLTYVRPVVRVKEIQNEGVLAGSTDYNEGWSLGDDE